MKHLKIIFATALFAAFALNPLPASAQDEETKPKPAAHSNPVLIDPYSNQDPNTDQTGAGLQPDSTPLTGLQTPTLGSAETRHSYVVPGVQYSSTILSRALGQAKSPGWYANNYFGGNLSLLQAWSRSRLSLNYSGGGFVSTDSTQGNGYFQQLGAQQSFRWEKWQLEFLDQFGYLPETQAGFGGGTGLSLPGAGGSMGPALPGLGSNPDQSIFSSVGPRYSNAFATQVTYAVSRRGSITASGSYDILHFVRAGNIDSDNLIGSLGYNYAVTREDTIGIVYRFTGYHYAGQQQAIGDHTFSLAYGRKITGRLALQIFGGPEVTTFRVPIAGKSDRISGSGAASLTYGFHRGSVALAYNYGLSGGSGILVGSNIDQLTATADRQLSRIWHGHMIFGYARNGSVGGVGSTSSQSYDSWIVGAGVDRALGRNANFTLGYAARIQKANQTACGAAGCGIDYTQHQIAIGLQWHTRPLVLH
jgi:hypothetical protein